MMPLKIPAYPRRHTSPLTPLGWAIAVPLGMAGLWLAIESYIWLCMALGPVLMRLLGIAP